MSSKINFYDFIKTKKSINPQYDKHGIKIPFRMLIAAPSGAGKTNCLMNLIFHMNKTFHEIILCVKSADEPLYERLIDKLGNAVRVYEDGEVPPITDFSIKDEATKRLKAIDSYQRLIIFDDLILEKKANLLAKEYYVKGRKLHFSMCYIGQSFYQIPKMIRDNCQYFILGRNLLKRDLRTILTVFPTDLSLDQFSALYNELLSDELDTMLINIDSKFVRKNIIEPPIKI